MAPVPPRTVGPRWRNGSADAIYQSLNLIRSEQPDLVAGFGANDMYRMDPAQMFEAHLTWGAGVTVAGNPVTRETASSFGIIRVAGRSRMRPPGEAGRSRAPPGRCRTRRWRP